MEPFRFRNFALSHGRSAQRIGTDSVLLAAVVPLAGVRRVLDVGCGCGVIGFCVADRLLCAGVEGFDVTGVDIDAASVGEARENAEAFPTKGRCRFDFRHASWQEYVGEELSGGNDAQRYDLIVSNPPYFVNSLKPEDSRRQLARHGDGSLPFGELVDGAAKLLAPGGQFFVILPTVEAGEFDAIASGKLSLISRTEIQPTPKKTVNRIILGYASASEKDVQKSRILIRDSENEFTENYRRITGGFYL